MDEHIFCNTEPSGHDNLFSSWHRTTMIKHVTTTSVWKQTIVAHVVVLTESTVGVAWGSMRLVPRERIKKNHRCFQEIPIPWRRDFNSNQTYTYNIQDTNTHTS